jgi:hypothetical protein
MSLLEQMNAAEYKKLLEFKEKFPTIGEELIQELTVKSFPIQLTLGDCVMLSTALDAPWGGSLHDIFQTFKSKP